ncbi:glycosyltransferase family 2 protein [Thalassococcus sp. CAU 1522]|uniref:Glycosyltransferase family 2 protein n=1 Tax=Thalassococcus arenae TaxID=2851652 RepID=A0ABS6N9E2_9RHOB|nr:glycosyltransferase family 2 protein [Thalassococcus arenae]MBV2360588.1 glycosyltransferase family 2 protein [Thalassococcus arenae]
MSSDEAGRRPTYPGGIEAVLTQMEGRRDGFDYAPGETLPPHDLDLVPLLEQRVKHPSQDPDEQGPFRSSYHRKRYSLRKEFEGEPELCFLNGLLIAHLRKRVWPDHAPALFRRLWAEHADFLIARLDARWLVSSVTTFGDHGDNPVQTAVGLAMNVLFGTMKLYETERLFSGLEASRPFTIDGKARGRLPLQMDAFSISHGGLDVNMIGRLWQDADRDPVIRPLAHHLLNELIHDDRTVFRRLRTMRTRKEKRDAASTDKPLKEKEKSNVAPVPARARALTVDSLRWGIVSTQRGPLAQLARFAAHHLEAGASALHIYLDEADRQAADWLAQHPRIEIELCDETYWEETGKDRPDAHQLRQAHNATRALRACADTLDWLGHVDVDEFLLTDRPMAEILATAPPSAAIVRLPPAEALARDDGPPTAYKITHKQARQPKAIVQDIYPTFGLHLYGGFLSHTTGKLFVRTGIDDTRLGIHAMKYRGAEATNRHKPAGAFIAHHHATSWDQFRGHLDFRRSRGSYRGGARKTEMGQAELFAALAEEKGDDALRAFFDEICADSPDLRDRLRAHGMLIEAALDLDGAVRRVFGALP